MAATKNFQMEERKRLVRRLQSLGKELSKAPTVASIFYTLGRIEQNKQWLATNLKSICVTDEERNNSELTAEKQKG
jgi:hypothetical protein